MSTDRLTPSEPHRRSPPSSPSPATPACARCRAAGAARGLEQIGTSHNRIPTSNGSMSHLHKGFTSVSPGFARFRRRFAGVSRGFRGRFAGVSRAFRPIRKPTNRFTWFSNPSLATQSFAKFTSLSHVSLHFRLVSQGILTKFRSRFATVSQPFHTIHMPLHTVTQL